MNPFTSEHKQITIYVHIFKFSAILNLNHLMGPLHMLPTLRIKSWLVMYVVAIPNSKRDTPEFIQLGFLV